MNRITQWTWVALAAGMGVTAVGCTSDSGSGDSGLATAPTVADPVPDLTITDEFTQTTYNSVNLLWVIDPEWQTALNDHRSEMAAFYELLLVHGVPWRVAVMTPLTEPELLRGELLNIHQFVDDLPAMGNQYTVFGQGPTNFRAAVNWTLTERYEEFQDYYFAGGHLSIISFADTADQTPPGFIGQQEFIQFLDEQDATLSASVSAITIGDPDVRNAWLDYANATGGVVTSSPDVRLNLERMALASLGLTKTWALSEVPAIAPQTLVVTYRANQRRLFLGEDYDYDFQRNTITLRGPAPFAGTRVTVRYERRVEGGGGGDGGAQEPTDGGDTTGGTTTKP